MPPIKKSLRDWGGTGGAVESVLGRPIEEDELPKLITFLQRQERNGKYFSKAMQAENVTDPVTNSWEN